MLKLRVSQAMAPAMGLMIALNACLVYGAADPPSSSPLSWHKMAEDRLKAINVQKIFPNGIPQIIFDYYGSLLADASVIENFIAQLCGDREFHSTCETIRSKYSSFLGTNEAERIFQLITLRSKRRCPKNRELEATQVVDRKVLFELAKYPLTVVGKILEILGDPNTCAERRNELLFKVDAMARHFTIIPKVYKRLEKSILTIWGTIRDRSELDESKSAIAGFSLSRNAVPSLDERIQRLSAVYKDLKPDDGEPHQPETDSACLSECELLNEFYRSCLRDELVLAELSPSDQEDDGDDDAETSD